MASDPTFAALIDAARGLERRVAAANKEGMSVPQIAGLIGIPPYEVAQMIDRYDEWEKQHA